MSLRDASTTSSREVFWYIQRQTKSKSKPRIKQQPSNFIQFNSSSFNSTPLNSTPPNSIHPNWAQPSPAQLHSARPDPTRLDSTQLNSTQSSPCTRPHFPYTFKPNHFQLFRQALRRSICGVSSSTSVIPLFPRTFEPSRRKEAWMRCAH
jgi:hypothetical protein